MTRSIPACLRPGRSFRPPFGENILQACNTSVLRRGQELASAESPEQTEGKRGKQSEIQTAHRQIV